MPSCARKDILDPLTQQVVHCWARCVRRCFLCGRDPRTGKDYNFRRKQIVRREKLLARLFAVEIAFHTELSNHVHLVLRNRPDIVQGGSALVPRRSPLRTDILLTHGRRLTRH